MLLALSALAADLQAGDLVFHRSASRQSEAIARATHSDLTHVGVVLEREGRLRVFEAVQPVGWAEIDDWTSRGRGLEIRRLEGLAGDALGRMQALAVEWTGRPYDAGFSWTDDRLYCSELVWKLFDRAAGVRLGELRRLRDFDLADPLVGAALRERYGARVPMDEPVIAPVDLARDPRLVEP
ncbi:MAG: YiiX/YebB-like N1pC/P60 family cysteine hydrolase [Myxococcota bacterium]